MHMRRTKERETFFFNLLPVELVHSIFDYLWAHQICDAFTNIDASMDRSLMGYCRYSIHFGLVQKRLFDKTCHLLRAHQVVSLRLTDLDDTPAQCELFFSKFPLEHLVNLRSFEMNTFNEKLFDSLSVLSELKYLRSLQLPSRLWHTIPTKAWIFSILPKLHRLVAEDDHLIQQPLDGLRSLQLYRCHPSEIQHLFTQIRHLRSLVITLIDFHTYRWPQETVCLIHLRRLILKVNGERIPSDVETC
jgi:hypothetical protein